MEIIHIAFDRINSTNTYALENYSSFQQNALTVISAKEQFAGRGRQKNSWESPAGLNIYATFCLFVPEEHIPICNIPQILAISCSEIFPEVPIQIKWPNDLMVNSKKIGGILCETKSLEKTRFIAVGIGLNVNTSKEQLCSISKPATSLFAETGIPYSVETILGTLEEKFVQNLIILFRNGFAPFLSTFRKKIYNPGEIRFSLGNSVIKGKIKDINPDGSILLDIDNDTTKTFYFGEIL